MNCDDLQENLYEYLDGTLASDEKSAAETHLLTCGACRQVLQNERLIEQRLSSEFKEAVDKIELNAASQRNITRALRQNASENAEPLMPAPVSLWHRAVFRLTAAGFALSLAVFTGYHFIAGKISTADVPVSSIPANRVIRIHDSYPAPHYTFRRDGAQVADALTFDTEILDGTLLAKQR